MRKSFVSRALGVALLAPALAGIVAAQPAHAAVSHQIAQDKKCQLNHDPKDRDTTGSCKVHDDQVNVDFHSHKSDVIEVPDNAAYPQGLTVIIPQPVKGKTSIQKGDTVDLRVDTNGRIALTVTDQHGRMLSNFAPVTMVAPLHHRHLYMLTRHGYVRIKDNQVTQPGLYRWV